MTKEMIPTKEESLEIFQRYVLFSNVEEHCVTVATIATYLAEKIKEKKLPHLNLDLVFATSLFHDLGKGLVIDRLEPEKYGFKPFTEEQKKIWGLLRGFYEPLKQLFADLNVLKPGFNKKIHETQVASIIIGALYPGFAKYMLQIGGTNDPVYYNAGPEMKIMHYADWIAHENKLVPFAKRLDYLFEVYGKEMSKAEVAERKRKEFALEKEIFENLKISPDLDLDELNEKKSKLFNKEYDYFKIGKVKKL